MNTATSRNEVFKKTSTAYTFNGDSNLGIEKLSCEEVADIKKGIDEYRSGRAKFYTLEEVKKKIDEVIAKYQ